MAQRSPNIPIVLTSVVIASSKWLTGVGWSAQFFVNLRQVGRG